MPSELRDEAASFRFFTEVVFSGVGLRIVLCYCRTHPREPPNGSLPDVDRLGAKPSRCKIVACLDPREIRTESRDSCRVPHH